VSLQGPESPDVGAGVCGGHQGTSDVADGHGSSQPRRWMLFQYMKLRPKMPRSLIDVKVPHTWAETAELN
ncbi:MAG TPA: hypothetical protein VE485_11200, partial [Mycobacterium sp.]|nr:hypothetical protein [Mycobacterium sp.]